MELQNKIEALLFYKGEPLTRKELAGYLSVAETEITDALESLKHSLESRGIRLLQTESEITLGTAPEMASILEELRKQELQKELSKASLETLSIIIYKNGATRGDIDYIRGVNGSFILRNLSARGLIEKVAHPEDSRKFLYKPTLDLLRFLGITNVETLPEFAQYNALLTQQEAHALQAEVETFTNDA